MLEGQKVVVFGGSSGVGLASAKLLASKGAEVIVAGRGAEKLDVKKDLGARGSAFAVDGKDVAAVEAFFEQVGAFDHLVIGLPHASL